MFFPLKDHNPTRGIPWVNYGLITTNIVVFLYTWLRIHSGEPWLVAGYGLVPVRVVMDPLGELFTVVTSMFMHGGWMHLVSNMVFLNVFGDNLEDALGHKRYILYYLVCGLAAAAVQVAVDMVSPIPMVGASGAIAGLVGGYMLLYPRAPVRVVNTLPLLWLFMGVLPVIPAWWVAAEFFVVNALAAVSATGQPSDGGVAVFAHLGGFFAGLLLLKFFLGTRTVPRRRWETFRPEDAPSERAGGARWRRRRRRW